MAACLLIDTSDWIPGALTIGDVGGGVSAAEIIAETASGDNGAGYLYNDAQLYAPDAEIAGRITSQPATGNFYAYENGSFSYTGGSGINYLTYDLYVDRVLIGSRTVQLNVGSGTGLLIDPVGIASSSAVGTPIVTAITQQSFGGWAGQLRKKTKEEIDDERRALGILPPLPDKKVIAPVKQSAYRYVYVPDVSGEIERLDQIEIELLRRQASMIDEEMRALIEQERTNEIKKILAQEEEDAMAIAATVLMLL